ncbi:MAG: shikimate dehydrogenase [Candidatus Nanopelagicales bacterium]
MSNVRRAGVLGSPISHSLSPLLHNAAYQELGLDWQYRAYDITRGQLADFLNGCDETWVGLSLTMPLKEAVLPLLDDIDPLAQRVGAANTVTWAHGQRVGSNTDVAGMVASIKSVAPVTDWEPGTATVIGAGATARSALAAIALLPGGERCEVTIIARRPAAALELAHMGEQWGLKVQGAPEGIAQSLSGTSHLWQADLVISTLPGDAWEGADLPCPQHVDGTGEHPFGDGTLGDVGQTLLMDVAYAPWPTRLTQVWQDARAPVATGADLLLWQAVGQIEMMTGLKAPVDRMRQVLSARLAAGES